MFLRVCAIKPEFWPLLVKTVQDISQGSVATRLRYGGISSDDFITNLLRSLTVKGFGKSIGIWRSYRQDYRLAHFLTQFGQWSIMLLFILRYYYHHHYCYSVLRPLYRTICVSRHPQLRTGGFSWSKVLQPACRC